GTGGFEAVVNTFKGTEEDIDVGFWNVEWLSKRYEEKVAAVSQVIREFALDVWSLEESSPAAATALVKELRDTHNLEFEFLAAEPDAAEGKQSCTVLWNPKTVTGKQVPWGEPIETWLKARSEHFDDLDIGGFEAVHGR